MSSFKLYLPSNACPDVYPNNTPTDFRTALDKPIQLEGNWEVGLESISYSSEIHDDTEHAQILLKVSKVTKPLLNSQSEFSYHLNKDNTWSGYAGVVPDTYETDHTKTIEILSTLNTINEKISTTGNVFNFRRFQDNVFEFEVYDNGFFLCLTPRLAQVLHFNRVLGKRFSLLKFHEKAITGPLTQEDYRVRYVNLDLQKSNRMTLKYGNTSFDGKVDSFIKLWKNYLKAYYMYIDIELKDGKLIITNHRDDLAIDFSPHLKQVFQQRWPIIGKMTCHITHTFQDIVPDFFFHHHWYVDIYDKSMLKVRSFTYIDIPISLQPWKSNTIRELLHVISSEVEKVLKHKMKSVYRKERHQFSLQLQPSQHVVLTLGKRLEIEFSRNLAYLLGFPNERFKYHTHGVREVDTLFNRARQLHVLTNIVQPTVVGKRQLQVLRDFVHQSTNENLSVKRFDIISYIPLRINRIDNIHMQIVNDVIETVKVKDVKTLVTLHFRKI